MNRKCETESSPCLIRCNHAQLFGGTEKNNELIQLRLSVSQVRFELGFFQIRVRSITPHDSNFSVLALVNDWVATS
jgi:hypothetical protein